MKTRIWLIDWDHGWPWGVGFGPTPEEALSRACQEVESMNGGDPRLPLPLVVTRELRTGEEVPSAYYPMMWRWHRPH